MSFLEIYEHMRLGFMGEPGSYEKQVIYTARARINRLKEAVKAAELEIVFWERIIQDMAPCGRCQGIGMVAGEVPYDEERMSRIKCPDCGGRASTRHQTEPAP